MSSATESRWPLWKTLAFACVAGCLFLGSRGLYGTTEGRYAECARQTMVSGQWLDPVLNGKPHWTKPPLTYLAIIAPMRAVGVNTWTARAYLVPFFLLAVAGVWLLGRHLGNDRRLGDVSALVFATSGFPVASCTVISTDVPLMALLILAQALYWRAIRTASRASIYGLWFVLGLAFMTKGPPSLLVLPAMAVAWRMLPSEQRRAAPLFAPGALLVYVVTAATWYIWEAARHPGLLQYWVHDEVINRSASDEFNRNPQFCRNFDIYLPTLVFGCWPWAGWLVFVRGKAWLKGWAQGFRTLSVGHALQRSSISAAVRRLSPEKTWSLLAFFLPIAVFFLSRSKLPLYVLPLFGPYAVFVAAGLLRAFERDTVRFWKWAGVLALSVWAISVAGKAALAVFPSERDAKHLYTAILSHTQDLRPERLAVFEKKQLNGLQFYMQSELSHFESGDTEAFRQWVKNSGAADRYVLLRPAHTNVLVTCVAPAKATFADLTGKWMLARISVVP